MVGPLQHESHPEVMLRNLCLLVSLWSVHGFLCGCACSLEPTAWSALLSYFLYHQLHEVQGSSFLWTFSTIQAIAVLRGAVLLSQELLNQLKCPHMLLGPVFQLGCRGLPILNTPSSKILSLTSVFSWCFLSEAGSS